MLNSENRYHIGLMPYAIADNFSPETFEFAVDEVRAIFVERFPKGTMGVHTITMDYPDRLPAIYSGLYGPLVGDPPVTDSEAYTSKRGARLWPGRLISKPARRTNKLTVIVGPEGYDSDGKAWDYNVYAMYAGPQTPSEPANPSLPDGAEKEKAAAFWAEHALSDQGG